MSTISPQILLKAYAAGIFPMAESAEDTALYWIDPDRRGVLPLEQFHLPRRLARTIRSERFEVTLDHEFEAVIEACANNARERESTWINDRIRALYKQLNTLGCCHSIETRRNGKLVGGLYGVRIGAAFFGESMFSIERDASKVALVYLIARLMKGGFTLLDTQFVTDHLRQFGTTEIEREAYHALLETALETKADFYCLSEDSSAANVLQLVSQTS